MTAIGGFRSDLSITREKRKVWKRFCGCFVLQSRVSTNTVVNTRQIDVKSLEFGFRLARTKMAFPTFDRSIQGSIVSSF